MESSKNHGRKRYGMVMVLGAAAVAGVVAVAGVTWQSYRASQWDDRFTTDLARALADVVPRAAQDAEKEVEAELERISVNGKAVTLAELDHWRELYAREGADAMRQAMSARFTPAEQRQLTLELERLLERWREKSGQDPARVSAQGDGASGRPDDGQKTSVSVP